jgi:hypothetical protein
MLSTVSVVNPLDLVRDDKDMESRKERILSLSTGTVHARIFNRFLFGTPFTKNGKTLG